MFKFSKFNTSLKHGAWGLYDAMHGAAPACIARKIDSTQRKSWTLDRVERSRW